MGINFKKVCVFLMFLLSITQIDFAVFAQPTIPKEKILSNIPLDVRTQIEKLYSVDPKERAMAVVSLWNMGEKATPAIPFLIELFTDPREVKNIYVGNDEARTVAGTAIKVLVKIGKPAVEPLISTLGDNNSEIRELSALALGKINDTRAVEPLIKLLNDKEWMVRFTAVRALAEIKDTRAVAPIIAILDDENTEVGKQAARALGKIKDPQAIEPLIKYLKNMYFFSREQARNSLKEITGCDFGQDIEKWQDWWEKSKDTFKFPE